jgi:AcrR family transcriptional regulator
MSVADLTRQVGISKGSFYLLYESKDTLVMTVLGDAEAEVRTALQETAADRSETSAETMTAIVRSMFDAVGSHPVLGLLADPEEGPHIFRMVPPEELAARAADDDRWFAELTERLKADGVMSAAVDDDALAAIARLALTVTRDPDLAEHRGLIGLLCESLGAQLAGDRA